ncbi:MAG: hypothetical protein ACRD2L_21585 [Terriglobia bacterium]
MGVARIKDAIYRFKPGLKDRSNLNRFAVCRDGNKLKWMRLYHGKEELERNDTGFFEAKPIGLDLARTVSGSPYHALGIPPDLAYEVEGRPVHATKDGKGKPILELFRST